ncbi:AcrR family transcriptional regulator [Mycobacterium frederiksbergense]|uniref:AcrR family transcriptional regulator n=1 Tax=Mycolicibacterium frederiksbergense TaxID=117567 RepID=A0ABT6L402_9MYCO|nr:TetR family transcriptional regulator C-terminal domain-containing protein [Mycolicibacterium frederiksbergense]MDH6197341.1 AcrR family transcriptional regulator [Mycolicibacterium frederiksbergense]
MPIEVDAAARLDQIAEATLRVADRERPAGVTIRAVAAELGGSTTVVTNYIKSRADLLLNAVRYELAAWRREHAEAIAEVQDDPRSRLREEIRWSTTTLHNDRAARQIWLDLVSRASSDGASELLRDDAAEHYENIRTDVADLAPADSDSDAIADGIYLAIRGFYFATTEDPEQWPPQRAAHAILKIADLLVGLDEGSTTRKPKR